MMKKDVKNTIELLLKQNKRWKRIRLKNGKEIIYEELSGGRVLNFATKEDREACKKYREEKRWEEFEKWVEKKGEEAYQQFLKEFKISDQKIKKTMGDNYFKIEDKGGFINFYKNQFPLLVDDRNKTKSTHPWLGKASGFWELKKLPDNKEREELMAFLLDKAIQGYIKYYAGLYQLTGEDFKDLKQEVEIQLLKSRGTLKPGRGANILTYYNRIIKNKAINLSKRRKYRYTVRIIKDFPNKRESQSRIETALEIEKIKALLPQLKESYRNIIRWHYLEELEITEIAKKLHKTENATRVMLSRALESLRKKIK